MGERNRNGRSTTDGDAAFGLHEIGQIMVPVTDLERAVAFYRDVLGMSFLFQVPRMAFFDVGGVRLMLGEPEGEGSEIGAILYYTVPDIEDACRVLGERGVEFRQGPTLIAEMEDHDLWMAFLPDSEGNQLALMAEVPKE